MSGMLTDLSKMVVECGVLKFSSKSFMFVLTPRRFSVEATAFGLFGLKIV